MLGNHSTTELHPSIPQNAYITLELRDAGEEETKTSCVGLSLELGLPEAERTWTRGRGG
jgi:hypothetical protein